MLRIIHYTYQSLFIIKFILFSWDSFAIQLQKIFYFKELGVNDEKIKHKSRFAEGFPLATSDCYICRIRCS